MDLYCPRCGEPVELDYLQHEVSPEERDEFWNGTGCSACKGKEPARRPFRADLAGALRDLLGDDVDGIAAELEDAEYMFPNLFHGALDEDGDG